MKRDALLLTIFFGFAYFLICTLFWIDFLNNKKIEVLILDLIFVIGLSTVFIDQWKLYFKYKDNIQNPIKEEQKLNFKYTDVDLENAFNAGRLSENIDPKRESEKRLFGEWLYIYTEQDYEHLK